MTLPIMKKKRKKKEDIKAGVQRLCIEDVVVVIVLTDNRLDNGNLVNPYESWVHTMRSHRHKRYKPTGWLDNLISILKDIAGLKIVHEERLPLLSAWIQDFADAQIIKDNWPPQAQMLANCHALLDASCTAAASK
uniref:Uncharacterized protein n=1 Tax=Vitis vinifera TaxID=29760 RepID=A5B466_VITVI|nr:hypothetical protein VITISV_016836 [Vitis vinifera]